MAGRFRVMFTSVLQVVNCSSDTSFEGNSFLVLDDNIAMTAEKVQLIMEARTILKATDSMFASKDLWKIHQKLLVSDIYLLCYYLYDKCRLYITQPRRLQFKAFIHNSFQRSLQFLYFFFLSSVSLSALFNLPASSRESIPKAPTINAVM